MAAKTIDEMAEAEICAMAIDEIERAIRLQCLEDGVPISVPVVPEPPVSPKVEPDTVVYEVAGLNLANRDDAERAAEILSAMPVVKLDYSYREAGLLQYTANGQQLVAQDVTVKRFVSVAQKQKYGEQIRKFDELQSTYKEAAALAESIDKQRSDSRAKIMRIVHSARLKEDERLGVVGRIEEYLTLCDGQGDLAKRYFEKAYPNDLEKYPELAALFDVRPAPKLARPPR